MCGVSGVREWLGVGCSYQARRNHVQDSTREKQERTTQYISHGVSCAGSDVRRAL